MYRALFPFQKTHPTSLTFGKDDVFIGLPGARADKNWHFVVDKKGNNGFVPRNYVHKEETLPSRDEFEQHLESIKEAVLSKKMVEKERADTLAKIEYLKANFNSNNKTEDKKLNTNLLGAPRVQTSCTVKSGEGEADSTNNIPKAPSPRPDSLSSNEDNKGSSKCNRKRNAPQPPSRNTTSEPISRSSDGISHNKTSGGTDHSNADSGASKSSNTAENTPRIFQNTNSGNSHCPNPVPVEAIAIVNNKSKKSKDKAKDKSKGNEIASKTKMSNSSNVQEPKNDNGAPLRNKETKTHSRNSSVETTKEVLSIWKRSSRTGSVAELSPEQIRTEARGLVEVIRELTGLSHTVSQNTAQTVLQYVNTNMNRLDRNVPALIAALEKPVYFATEEIAASSDSKCLESIFQRLVEVKDDTEQRNWTLHEDEEMIVSLLNRLNDSLQTCDQKVSLYVMRRRKYDYILTLVEYFQMETRRSIRMLLLDAFFIMCSLDPSSVISLMLNSVLPPELAQDLYAHTPTTSGDKRKGDFERARITALLLTVIFSRGEPMPVQYSDHGQLGRNFVDFILESIEKTATSRNDDISDVFIGLMLSFNLQFDEKDVQNNFLIERLAMEQGAGHGAKTYTEKILLLLNREDDPAAVVGRDQFEKNPFDDWTTDPFSARSEDEDEQDQRVKELPNSVQKVILDMFRHKHARNLFYTNDLFVLIDIIIRQLSDLDAEDVRRLRYLEMCQLVLVNGADYNEHLHRFKDLQARFMRILEEEGDSEEKNIVLQMCKAVSAFDSLVTVD